MDQFNRNRQSRNARRERVVTVRQRTNPGGQTGWEAVTLAAIVTTHTIGLRETADEVVALVERMASAGMMEYDRIEVRS